MTQENFSNRDGIGTLAETSLHAGLIDRFSNPGDSFEVKIEGFLIDIQRGNRLIEIQTRNLGKLKNKILTLKDQYPIDIIFPIATAKWILKTNNKGKVIQKRKSPKKGKIEDIFNELVNAPLLITPNNVSLIIAMIHAEEIWKNDGKGSWRRKKWSIVGRNLLEVHDTIEFCSPTDFLSLLPKTLSTIFTNKILAEHIGISQGLATKMTFSLRKMGMITLVGKKGRENLYSSVKRN